MILARNSVTLSWVRDIASIWRYYKLQASTASKPSKPTAYPPSGWQTSEPSYTSGSTNSLYTVECTVYVDGTFDYSEVSLSSSYEAAKEAYNKANAAQSTANTAKSTADTAKSTADAAKTAAANAQTAANSKNAVFYQTSAPTGTHKVNDIWFDTGNGNAMYAWDGTQWAQHQFGTVSIGDGTVTADKLTAWDVIAQKLVSNIAEIADFTIMEHWIQSSGTYTNEGGFDADVSMYLRNTDGIQPPQIEFGSRGDALFNYPTLALLTVGGGGTRATGVSAFDWVKLAAVDEKQGLEAFVKVWAKNRLVELSADTVQADGDLSISGSIQENGTKLSDKYAAKTHTHGEYATWYTMTASDIDAGSPFASGFSIGSAVINNVGYLRFNIRWMTLEFKLEQPSKGLHVRYKYGDSAWTAWSKL